MALSEGNSRIQDKKRLARVNRTEGNQGFEAFDEQKKHLLPARTETGIAEEREKSRHRLT